MDITEATKKAIERDGFITRREFRNQGMDILIKPTNSSEACITIVRHKNEMEQGRCWNPSFEDITAKDWEAKDEI